jgi:flagellin
MAVINTNIAATQASMYLNQNSNNLTSTISGLASGSRLSDPSKDAAGVAVSGNLVARIGRLSAASNAVGDVVSAAQTTDGFLATVQSELTRMSELAQEATNGAFGTADLANYDTEFQRLSTQIGNIVSNASFDGTKLFSANTISVAVNADGFTDTFALSTLGSLASLGLTSSSVGNATNALAALSAVNSAITLITTRRAAVNADVSKFNFYIQNITTENTNLTAANSRVADLDIAQASSDLSKYNILLQASTSALAQANSAQQTVLSLIK